MKKTKYIQVALVTAALASCKPSYFSSGACHVPVPPEDSAYSPNQDSIACLEYERAYFNCVQAYSPILNGPCADPVSISFFGLPVYKRFGHNLTNFILRGGFGASFAKVAS